MSTNNELIRDALGLIGVVSEAESLSADQAAHGLRALNDMLAEWEANNIFLGWIPQTDITEETPLADSDVAGVKYNLAVELAPYYERSVSQEVAIRAGKYYSRIERDSVKEAMVEQDVTHIPMGTGHWFWKDITQG